MGPITGNGTPVKSPTKHNESFAFEIKKLQNEIKLKHNSLKELQTEVEVLKSLLDTKDAAIEQAEKARAEAEERALVAEGKAKSLLKESKKWDLERQRLKTQRDSANEEADRLNQLLLTSSGNNAKTLNGSMEDVVRLHNQLAEARKEIQRLKEDNKGYHNVVLAKDRAIVEMEQEVSDAREANARRKEDHNVIIDLKRQIVELESRLGGEFELGKLVESEADSVKRQLEMKEEELENALKALQDTQEQILEAQKEKLMAERSAAIAAEKMAAAMEEAEKAIAAESLRMQHGGYVPKEKHLEELSVLKYQLESAQAELQGYQAEHHVAKSLMKRILQASDDEIDTIMLSKGVAEKFGNGIFTIQELRNQVKELTEIVTLKEGAVSGMKAGRDAAIARATSREVEIARLKIRLAEIMGDNYSLEMHEPPPTSEDLARLQAEEAARRETIEAYNVEKMHLDMEQVTARALAAEQSLVALKQKLANRQESTAEDTEKRISEMELDLITKSDRIDALELQVKGLKKSQSQLEADLREKENIVQSTATAMVSTETFESMVIEKDEEISALHCQIRSVEAKNQVLHEQVQALENQIKQKQMKTMPPDLTGDRDDPVLDMNAKEAGHFSQMEQDFKLHATSETVNESCIASKLEPADALPIETADMQQSMKTPDDLSEYMEVTPNKVTAFDEDDEGLSCGPSPQKQFGGVQVDGLSAASLRHVLDKLLNSRREATELQLDNESELYNEAIALLQSELSRLSIKMAEDSDTAQKLKSEVGDLRTARLSAETTAELLEAHNAMSMKIAAQQIAMQQREIEFCRREENLIQDINMLRMEVRRLKSKPGALRSMKKAMSSTIKGVKKSLDGKRKDIGEVSSVSPLSDVAKTWDSIEK